MDKKQIESINWQQEFPEIPKCVQVAIQNANHTVSQKKQRKHLSKKSILLLVAALTLFAGMTTVAAEGLWQQRVEALNEEEMLQYFASITTSNAPAFRYNRGMTDAEKEQYEALKSAYEMEGVFPESILTMLSEGEKYSGKGVAYETNSGTFFLPEKELTSEQLLQIIDFYHKVDYSLQQVSLQIENGDITLTEDNSTEAAIEKMQDFEPINDVISYYQVALEDTEMPKEIAAGTNTLYLGYENEIQCTALGTNAVETFYTLKDNEKLFALDADKANNLFLSVREYGENSDTRIDKIIKVDDKGQIVVNYDVTSAVSQNGKKLSDLSAYKMVEDEAGNLYVKTFWADKLLLFVFYADGTFKGTIETSDYETHPAGEMCLGKDGNLYVLGKNEIISIDANKMQIIDTFEYLTDDMIAAVDLLYPIYENTFYMVSYDGVYKIDLEEESSQRMLSPYEKDVLKEGVKCYPVDNHTIVLANREDWGVNITYLSIAK